MRALIDGDILTYRIGYTTQEVPVAIACHRMDELINGIVDGCGADELSVYLSSTGQVGFRYKIYEKYKANRKQPKPVWYKELRAHLVSDYDAMVTDELEADDALGIAQNNNTVICSIDKDLDQIPGKHYDFVKHIMYEVSPDQAIRFFYAQLLQGDRVDNIPGIPGIGPRKSDKILQGLSQEKEYLQAAIKAYQEAKLSLEYMSLMGRLLKIKRDKEEPLWDVEREAERLGVAVLKTSSKSTSKRTNSTTDTSHSTLDTPSQKQRESTNQTT